MFRNIFGMLAALIVSTNATSVAAHVPLNERIANAQAKISELGSLAAPSEAGENKSKDETRQHAQHWHNHHWNNWHNWNNWGNHHHHR